MKQKIKVKEKVIEMKDWQRSNTIILLEHIKKQSNGRELIIKSIIHKTFPEIKKKNLNLHIEMAP